MSSRRKRLSEFLQPQGDVDLQGVHPDLPKAIAENGNELCSDCNALSPGWVEVIRGITLCRACAAAHHMLGSDTSHIECIKAGEEIDDSVVKRLATSGNKGSNAELEAHLSKAYRRPSPEAYDVYRKQFISAKYLRREFCSLEAPGLHRRTSAIPQPYITGEISYPLMKRGREKDLWQSRCLEAYSASGKLRYLDRPEGRELGSIPLGAVNVALVAEKDLNGEGDQLVMVVTYPEFARSRKPSESSAPSAADAKEGKDTRTVTRSLFFRGYDNLNGRDIVEWYVAIRYAKMSLRNALHGTGAGTGTGTGTGTGIAEVTSDFKKLGWLHKKGGKVSDQFRVRWFVLEKNVVRYSEFPMDAVPKGEFELHRGPGYGVIEGIEGDDDTPFAFTVITPNRDYYMHATSETYPSWLAAFGSYCLQSASLSTA